MTDVTFDLLDVDGSVLATNLDVSEAGWQHTRLRTGVGSGSVTIANDDPDRDLAIATGYRMIRANLDGTARFVWVIKDPAYTRVGDSDELATVLSGPDVVAALGSDDVPAAVVEGYRNSGILVRGWVEPGTDFDIYTASWTGGDSFGAYVDDPDGSFIYSAPAPDEWPYADCDRTTAVDNYSDGAGAIWHDPSSVFFHRYRTPNLGNDRRIKVFVAGTNHVWVWWNGEQVVSGIRDGKNHTYKMSSFEVDADGDGLLAIRLLNGQTQGGPGVSNVAWTMYVGYVIDEDGTFDPTTPIFWSSTGKGLWYDGTTVRPESITAGYVLSRLIDDAKARGCLPGFTYTFTDALDSNGSAFTRNREIVTYRDEENYLPVTETIVDDFDVDVDVTPTLEVQLVQSLGSASGVDLTDGVSVEQPVAGAQTKRKSPGPNVARVQTGEGFAWVENAGRVASDGVRREGPAEYGTAGELSEIQGQVVAALSRLAGGWLQTFQTAGPAGARPYTNYGLADTVGARTDDGGAYVAHTVESLLVALDDATGEAGFEVDGERLA